jgi:hypothetical protein
MKKLRKLILWLVIGILIENGCFLYLNNDFLVKKLYVTSKNISSSILEDTLVKLPQKAEDIKISDDDKYAAYSLKNTICIVNLTTKKTLKVPVNAGEELTLFKWMPYKDEIYYLLKTPNAETDYSLRQFNLLNTNSITSTDIDLKHSPDLKNKGNITIKDVKRDVTGTNNFILEVQNDASLNLLVTLLNFSTKNFLQCDSTYFSNITKFCTISSNDYYLYQNSGDNKIYTNACVSTNLNYAYLSRNMSKAFQSLVVPVPYSLNQHPQYLKLDNISNPLLIGSDTLGHIYIGSLNASNKVSSIYTVSLASDTADFKKYSLGAAEDENNISVTSDSGIFIVHKNYVINVETKKKTEYHGKFVQISSNKLFYIYNGNLTCCDLI